MPRPNGQPEYTKRSRSDQAADWTGRVSKKATKFDVAIGPLEVAATYALFAIAGIVVGVNASKLIPGACDLPLLAIIGLVGGLLLAIPARNIRGHRIGLIGATIIALMVIAIVGQLSSGFGGMATENKFREACLHKQEKGYALPDACKEELSRTTAAPARLARRSINILLILVEVAATLAVGALLWLFLKTGRWQFAAALLVGGILFLLLPPIVSAVL